MIVGLVNLDSKLPNIALEKIKMYYKNDALYTEPIETIVCDRVYCSSIFTFTDKSYVSPKWICGGTGFNLTTKLPPEIECMKPKINYGVTTRGCIRKCPFCVVPEKEGNIYITGDIYDIWDGKSKNICLYDNNILALPEHFIMICNQIKKEKIRIDFNQGLDHRLLTDEICKYLKSISHKDYHFAFDNIKYEKTVRKAIELLKLNGINRSTWYTLVGYDSCFEEDLYRVELLKSLNQNAFIQRYNYNIKKYDRKYNELSSWCAQHNFFQAHTFKEFCKVRGFDYQETMK